MKRSYSKLIIYFLLLIIALLANCVWYLYTAHAVVGGRQVITPVAPEKTLNGEYSIDIDLIKQKASGIEVAALSDSLGSLRMDAFATVVDAQILFELSTQLATSRSNIEVLRVQKDTSLRQFERAKTLYARDKSISLQVLQDADSALQSDSAKLKAEQIKLTTIKTSLRNQFGEVIAQACEEADTGLIRSLAMQNTSLIRATLAHIDATAVASDLYFVDNQGAKYSAHLLSQAPQVDTAIQGASYFYSVQKKLAMGSRLQVGIENKQNAVNLFMPESAVVWFGGQPWAFVRITETQFVRRSMQHYVESDNGFFVKDGFKQGDWVAVKGAQLLLSEEMRPKNFQAACADPPECDD